MLFRSMGFVIPFKNAVESPNVFVKADKEMTAAGKTQMCIRDRPTACPMI